MLFPYANGSNRPLGDADEPVSYIGEDNSFTLRSMHGKHGPYAIKEE